MYCIVYCISPSACIQSRCKIIKLAPMHVVVILSKFKNVLTVTGHSTINLTAKSTIKLTAKKEYVIYMMECTLCNNIINRNTWLGNTIIIFVIKQIC